MPQPDRVVQAPRIPDVIMNNQKIVDVDAVLDTARFRGLPLLVMIGAATIMILDGFDIQVIGFAAPAIATDLGVDRKALAPALAASLIGMAIGGFVLGPWGDRYGRRPALLLSSLLFGLGTLATAAISSLEMLAVLRLITGIGLGGALPNSTALMAEFSPPRIRAQTIAVAIAGVPVGGMIGAAIAAEVIPAFGWKAIFVIGGVLPLFATIAIYFLLPESARYLISRPGRERELAAILNRLVDGRRFSGDERFVTASQAAKQSADGVFAAERLRDTIVLWILFGSCLFAVYCFYNWSPVVLNSLGMELATAVRGSLVFNTAGVIGSLVASSFVARFGSRVPLAVLCVIGALALYWVGQLVGTSAQAPGQGASDLPVVAIMTGIGIAGFCILALQVMLYAVAANVYPTSCRSAGVGWAQSVGRLGGVLSAFGGAAILARTGSSGFFVTITFVLALTLLAVLLLQRHIRSTRQGVALESAQLPSR